MREIVAALALLTRIPVGRSPADATGAAAFGLVGALVGGLGAIVIVLLGGSVPALAAILAIGAMALVSGGLHLDGLADTADALLAPDPARAEAARHDPAIGSGGTVALILVLAAQVASLASLAAGPGPVIAGLASVAAGAASRTLPLIAVGLGAGRVPPSGLGAWFAERVSRSDTAIAVTTAVLAIGVAGLLAGAWELAIGLGLGFALGVAGAAWLLRVRGQVDGDLLGATVEVGLAAMLGAAAVAASVAWPAR
jgi:adenosylcobinamide-GDP ribazoletransferase